MNILKHSMFCLLGLLVMSCEKADNHYYDYKTNKTSYNGTIYEYLINQPGVYDSLALVLERLPDLKAKLNTGGSMMTYFAANNRAFEIAIGNMNSARQIAGLSPLYLQDLDRAVLDTLAYRYVFDSVVDVPLVKPYLDGVVIVSAKYDYDMHAQYKVLTSSGFVGGGEQQILFSDVNESIYQRYWQRVPTKAVDMELTNGVLHTLSSQHDFGFGKLTTYYAKK